MFLSQNLICEFGTDPWSYLSCPREGALLHGENLTKVVHIGIFLWVPRIDMGPGFRTGCHSNASTWSGTSLTHCYVLSEPGSAL